MPKLMWQGVPYLFTKEREAGPQDAGAQGQNQREYREEIRQLYGVEELQGYTEEELAVVKKYFDPLPPVLVLPMKSKGKYRFISKGSPQKSAERSGAQGPSVVIYLIRSHINRREVLYGAASEAGYKKLMEVMEGLGEAI